MNVWKLTAVMCSSTLAIVVVGLVSLQSTANNPDPSVEELQKVLPGVRPGKYTLNQIRWDYRQRYYDYRETQPGKIGSSLYDVTSDNYIPSYRDPNVIQHTLPPASAGTTQASIPHNSNSGVVDWEFDGDRFDREVMKPYWNGVRETERELRAEGVDPYEGDNFKNRFEQKYSSVEQLPGYDEF